MNTDQVKTIRSFARKSDGSGNPMAFSLSAVFNNEVTFNDTDHFVIWDDSKELVHCIMANIDGPISGAIAPYKINTGFYDNIQYLEAIYNMHNFSKALDELFVSTGLITEDKKTRILAWADTIRNHVDIPDNNVPYFDTTPKIPAKAPSAPPYREDGMISAAPIGAITPIEQVNTIAYKCIEEAGYEHTGNTMYISAQTFNSALGEMRSFIYEIMRTIDGSYPIFYGAVSNGHMSVDITEDMFTSGHKDFMNDTKARYPEINGISLLLMVNNIQVKYIFEYKGPNK